MSISPYPLYAFHVLESRLLSHSVKYPLQLFKNLTSSSGGKDGDTDSPLFVTWDIEKNGENSLRGCIGTFADQPLEKGIKEYAEISAFQDPRFDAISPAEFSKLSVDITLLQNFTRGEDALDWELGKHGIRIHFNYKGSVKSGTYLPSVAVDQGWTKDWTIINLIAKAGGDAKKVDFGSIQLTRYEGIKSGIDYRGYKEFMNKNGLETVL
ncbi:hypothetical protein BN7_223 [Wickerhamomyces ciferrii]|uniref:AMMECR1 domain-containing protein n=1 Tax=Wickerhamomyces ciferrii (strain ATCC 14091 / BCRC 22168 / CBS 111 / JCM 3599 / NBRC 0793 / NRRL Y-1031 F-60-10) TaxID=1206466 RepID=K0KH29_WICCF|nr:uncharacterized protein BN7_223 [Wickerhamomyces ciferrii]CCH40689.1 hypothetical protein BN7_223 [Wickerhamomyces ciferrii]